MIRMFNEKNIPKLIILSPIITGTLITILTVFFFIKTQNNNFHEESLEIEKQFKHNQRILLKNRINTISSYLEYQESIYLNKTIQKVVKRTYVLSKRLNYLNSDLNINTEKEKDILVNLINSKILKDNYFFAYNIKTNSIIQPLNKDIKKEFYDDGKFFENYLFYEKGKVITFEKSDKIVYLKYLPKLNWIIGNIENIQSDINFIKYASLKYINSVNTNNISNIWIYDNNHKLLNQLDFPKIVNNKINKDKNNIIKKIVASAKNNPNGTLIYYKWKKR